MKVKRKIMSARAHARGLCDPRQASIVIARCGCPSCTTTRRDANRGYVRRGDVLMQRVRP